MNLTEPLATRFAGIALRHLNREYPNKLEQILTGPDDLQPPHVLHPIFHGSFDWHSSVHAHWLLCRLYRRFPDADVASEISARLDGQFTREKAEAELSFILRPENRGFERPYGWAWLLMLASELRRHETEDGRRWAAVLAPLAAAIARRMDDWLSLSPYPNRTGAHPNTAFALALAIDYARSVADRALEQAITRAALTWYAADRDCPAWEPDGDSFLSPTLIEAECMRRVLPPAAFRAWFATFLPGLDECQPATLFEPPRVTDRTDGKIAHLDGLALSRAWCWRRLAEALEESARDTAAEAAARHLATGLPHVAGDYAGEHWLASFALLALDDDTLADGATA